MKRIPLSQGREALVSDCDYKYLMQWKWYFSRQSTGSGGYAARCTPRPHKRTIKMHKVVAARKGLTGEIDHRNQDKLDNRRSNLRQATRSQNKANCGVSSSNKSGFKGVSCYKTNQWQASIRINGKTVHLGHFHGTSARKRAAARAYNRAASRYFGVYAVLNKV